MPLKNFPEPSAAPTRRKDAGIWNHTDGYKYEYCPEHPRRNKRGGVLQHRLVMEEHLGRFLAPKEVVHHINGDKSDNRIENLELLQDQSSHIRGHFRDAPLYSEKIRSEMVSLAANPRISIGDAQKKLGISHGTVHNICKKYGIQWIYRFREYPPAETVERTLLAHSRKEAVAILGIPLQTLWNQYPELMRKTSNPKRLKTHDRSDEPADLR
jgi:hypothetical protein